MVLGNRIVVLSLVFQNSEIVFTVLWIVFNDHPRHGSSISTSHHISIQEKAFNVSYVVFLWIKHYSLIDLCLTPTLAVF